MLSITSILQIVLTIFLFSISIPNIIYAILPDDIKAIYNRYRKKKSFISFSVSLSFLILCLLWLHDSHLLRICKFSRPFFLFLIKVKVLIQDNPWAIYFVVTSIIIVLTIFGTSQLRKVDLRKKIIAKLRKCIDKHDNEINILNSQEFRDLCLLGTLSSPGYNKQLVLNELIEILQHFAFNDSYDGDKISEILKKIELIITNDSQKWEEENIHSIQLAYIGLLERMNIRTLLNEDYLTLTKSVERISSGCFQNKRLAHLATNFLDFPVTKNSKVDFYLNIAKDAVKQENYLTCLAVHNQFLNILSPEMSPNQYCNYIGSISYFYCIDDSFKSLIVNCMKDVTSFINLNNIHCYLDESILFFTDAADFSTVKQIKEFKKVLAT